jgi:hypothetical protein
VGRRNRSKARTPQASKQPDDAIIAPVAMLPWQYALPIALILTTIAVYWNSMDKGFVLDDDQHIVRNKAVQEEGSIASIKRAKRPTVVASLIMNFKRDAEGQLDPFGYHLFNLVVHLAAALLLFDLIRRTLQLPTLEPYFKGSAVWIAWVTALLWAIHPLQTQSVTYIIQRCESIMGCCYLAVMYCVVRAATGRQAVVWTIVAIFVAGVGAGSKAVIITAPVMALVYDRIFLSPTFAKAMRQRVFIYAGTMLSIIMVGSVSNAIPTVLRVTSHAQRKGGLAKTTGRAQTPMQYRAAQPEVVLHYLKLSTWPKDLCLDYKWPPVSDGNYSKAAVPALAIGVLVGGTAWALWACPPLGFIGLWFFLILAPTSWTWTLELCFEHRMYLSLAAVIMLAVVAVHAGLRRLPVGIGAGFAALLVIGVAAALGLRTVERNKDYENRLVMNQAVIAVRPQNDRAQYNTANALRRAGQLEEALPHYEAAIAFNPRHANAMVNYGLTLNNLEFFDEASEKYDLVLEIAPKHRIGLANYAINLYQQGRRLRQEGFEAEGMDRLAAAADMARRSLAVRPNHAKSRAILNELSQLGL